MKFLKEFLDQDFSGLIIAVILAMGIIMTACAIIAIMAGILAKIIPETAATIISIALFVGLTLLIYGILKLKKKED